MSAGAASLRVRALDGFDDPALAAGAWDRLLEQGNTPSVFLTAAYQRAWWATFGRGRLLLLGAEREGRLVALAPLFVDGGMAFFTGSGGSDYLDFIGDLGDPEVLPALLSAARAEVPDLLGFRFYLVPDASRTGARLQAAAARIGLVCHDEGSLLAPALALDADPAAALEATRKKSLLRHEKYFQREGALAIEHLRDGAAILSHLDAFFDQHVARWQPTPHPSLFLDPAPRDFYRRLARDATPAGWVRFTRVLWNGAMIAAHFGFCHRGVFLWYKPSFDPALARHSPGEVLLRQLLLAALAEGAHTFDFGLGDEPFKRRFATRLPEVRTWGLYPADAGGNP